MEEIIEIYKKHDTWCKGTHVYLCVYIGDCSDTWRPTQLFRADDMHVQVVNRLTSLLAVVNDISFFFGFCVCVCALCCHDAAKILCVCVYVRLCVCVYVCLCVFVCV